MVIFLVVLIIISVVALAAAVSASPEEQAVMVHGQINRQMICPHCDTKEKVHSKLITQKKGVSGGKATAALLTGGVSLLATGLSRKEKNTQAHFSNCNSSWLF